MTHQKLQVPPCPRRASGLKRTGDDRDCRNWLPSSVCTRFVSTATPSPIPGVASALRSRHAAPARFHQPLPALQVLIDGVMPVRLNPLLSRERSSCPLDLADDVGLVLLNPIRELKWSVPDSKKN
jgi:hypothetical protein